MTAATLLSRLDRVRQTGPGRWVACCPSHDSTSKSSLAIRELPDGRVLLHDFGGCSTEDVLGAVGLEMGDLFPERIDTTPESKGDRRYRSRQHQRFDAASLIRVVHAEVLMAATIISRFLDGHDPDEVERAALWSAAGRIADAVGVLDGR
jgi:hypothetical protein